MKNVQITPACGWALLTALTLAGCATTNVGRAPQISPVFAQLKNDPDRIALTALARGRIEVRNGCVVLAAQNADLSLIWPDYATFDSNTLRIRSAVSHDSAMIGKRVKLGGGSTSSLDLSSLAVVPASSCRPPYFIVSNFKLEN